MTHDRSLMARVATRVLEVSGGRVILYPGGYDDYEGARLARVAEDADRSSRVAVGDASRRAPGPPPPHGRAAAAAASGPAAPARADRATQNAARRRERDLARLEGDIAEREKRIADLETRLADPALYHDAAKSKDLVAEYERVRAELESLWQRLAEMG